MSLQKKYYYTFKGLDNTSFLAEIWQDTTATITAEEITGDSDPFNIEYPTTGIFEPVKGSGCTLNLLSTTDRKFLNLYTANMLEYQIKLYKSGVLYWCGYLDSELYSEPFNQLSNYTVTFTGSDGFALLERFNYVDNSGNRYNGLSTQWQVLQNILNKLNLPYKNIYVGLSTTCTDFTLAASETLLHKTYCNSNNWYNEDGDAETARKVLESILEPYAAFIFQDNANIYITDINTVAGASSASFKKYSTSFTYISTDTLNLNLGDLSSIKFAASDQQQNTVSGFNKQIIKYSPYKENSIIDYEEEIFTGTSTDTNFGLILDTWTRKYYTTSDNWNKLNEYGKFCEMVGTNDNASASPEKYLVISPVPTVSQSDNNIFTYKKAIPNIVFSTSKQFYLKIDAKVYVRTLEEKSALTSTLKVSQVKLKTNITIGNKRYRWDSDFGSSKGWYPVEQPQHHTVMSFTNVVDTGGSYSMSNISDSWTNLNVGYIDVVNTGGNNYTTQTRKPDPLYIPIPLNGSIVGDNITFAIGDYKAYNNAANRVDITSTIQDIRLKDIKITIVDSEYKPIEDKDIEHTGYMDKNYKNEGDSITLYQGSSVKNSPIEKGSLMGFSTNYYYLNTWTREGKTDCIERLLIRSIVSNYSDKRLELSATINKVDSILGCLKYQSFLPNMNLMIVGCTQNLADSTTSVTLQEILPDTNIEINYEGWKQ